MVKNPALDVPEQVQIVTLRKFSECQISKEQKGSKTTVRNALITISEKRQVRGQEMITSTQGF